MLGSVIAQSPITAEESNLFERIVSFFTDAGFTIVGQDVGASVSADETWDNILPGTVFNKDADDYCSSGHGLFDVFVDNWVPRFEMKDWAYFNCGSDNQKCIVELYCMPHDFCSSDSQCESWEGTGSECKTKSAVDPIMPLIDASTGNPIISYTYCTDSCTGPDIDCWRILGDACEQRTYSCSYETYPDCPFSYPYISLGSCEADLETCDSHSFKSCYVDDVYWYDSCNQREELYESCDDGCEDGVCLSAPTGDCTSEQTKCVGTTYYTCVNENWENQGQVIGECGYTGEEDSHYMAEIRNIEIDKTKVSPKGTIIVTGKIKNNLDNSQKYLLEVGIIPSGIADDWYIPYETPAVRGEVKLYDWASLLLRFPTLFATIEHTPETQCCEGQENIEDYWITLEPDEEYDFSLNVKASHSDIEDKCGSTDYWVGEGDYVVYAYLTTGCTIEGPEYPGIKQGVATTRVEISGEDLESQIALTKKEWEEALELKDWELITSSMCTLTSQCGKIEDYDVECKKSDEIWDGNYKAIKENWGEFTSDISFFLGWGILPERLADIGIGVTAWLTEAEEDVPRGTCRASKGGELCKFLSKAAVFDITGDECTDGGIIMVGGLLLFIIIFSRMAGCYCRYEINVGELT